MGYGKGRTELGIEREDRDVHKRKMLSEEAMDKIVYDVLASDKGLAALATGENLSGGFNTSSKGLLAQDLAVKVAGELANITADEWTQTSGKKKNKRDAFEGGGNFGASSNKVICTELVNQNKLPLNLYHSPVAIKHFYSLPQVTREGYWFWAEPLAEKMGTSPRLSDFFVPIVLGRYEYIVNGKKNLLGLATVYIGEPLCFLLGSILHFLRRIRNGRKLSV